MWASPGALLCRWPYFCEQISSSSLEGRFKRRFRSIQFNNAMGIGQAIVPNRIVTCELPLNRKSSSSFEDVLLTKRPIFCTKGELYSSNIRGDLCVSHI